LEINTKSLVVTSAVTRTPQNAAAIQLLVGQRLSATVVEQFPDTKQLLLRIGGQLFRAQSNTPIVPGQNLQVEVSTSGKQPQLKIINPGSEAIQNAIRSNIGQQSRPEILVRQLLSFIHSNTHETITQGNLKSLATDFVRGLSVTKEISTGPGFKQAFLNSGIFLESKLLATPPNQNVALNLDLKARLIRFISNLNREPKSNAQPSKTKNQSLPLSQDRISGLIKGIEEHAKGALSKIVLDQIASLPESHSEKQSWNTTLPFLNGESAESVKLTIQRDQKDSPEYEQQDWSVVLELTPPHLGLIRSKITLSGNNSVDTHFISDQSKTNTLIHDHVHVLREKLEQAGLSPGNLDSSQAEIKPMQGSSYPMPIFDEKA